MTTHTISYTKLYVQCYKLILSDPKKHKKMSTERIITMLQYNVIYSTFTINKVFLFIIWENILRMF